MTKAKIARRLARLTFKRHPYVRFETCVYDRGSPHAWITKIGNVYRVTWFGKDTYREVKLRRVARRIVELAFTASLGASHIT